MDQATHLGRQNNEEAGRKAAKGLVKVLPARPSHQPLFREVTERNELINPHTAGT